MPCEKGVIDKEKLSVLQSKVALLPHALHGYLEKLSSQKDNSLEGLRKRFEELWGKARVGEHDRLPETVAHLHIGLEFGVTFARAKGALDHAKAEEILACGWEVFVGLAREHGRTLSEERPTRVFLQALEEAFASERAWLADRATGKVSVGTSGPGSQKLGWIDDEGIYLLPETAFAFAPDRLRHRGGVTVSGASAINCW